MYGINIARRLSREVGLSSGYQDWYHDNRMGNSIALLRSSHPIYIRNPYIMVI